MTGILGIIVFLLLLILFWIGLKITGAILKAMIWLCIRLPLAIVFWTLGIVLCCTILLMPLGKLCIKLGTKLLI